MTCRLTSNLGKSFPIALRSSLNWSVWTMMVAALLFEAVQCRRARRCKAVATFTYNHESQHEPQSATEGAANLDG